MAAFPSEAAPPAARGLAYSATILAFGNVGSRLLGLARETIIAHYFGASGLVSAFRLAATVPTMLYDLLIGGLLSAALVPVLSALIKSDRRAEFGRVAGAVLTIVAVGGAVIVLLLEVFAPNIIAALGSGFDAGLQAVATRSLRILAPAVWCFLCSGIITGILYAQERFIYPAVVGAVFNLGIVVTVPLLSGRLDAYSLAVGLTLGSALQLLTQLPGLRHSGLRLSLNVRHPALRQIVLLNVPIVLGLFVTQFQIAVDRNLASGTGDSSIAWMQNATTLIQFPLGLVSVAVSLAALPTLSQLSARGDWDGFRHRLARGLRLVLVLMLPATVGLAVLGVPLIRLVFEHGAFGPNDTYWASRALWLYLVGLPFAAIDWPLNFAFYAQQDTRTPALVGVASVGVYLVTALTLVGTWGMPGLVLADSAKQMSHALLMLWLLGRRRGRLHGEAAAGILRTGARSALAALAMGGGVWLAVRWLEALWPVPTTVQGALIVGMGAAVGGGLYAALLVLLRVDEARTIWLAVRQRIRP